VEYDGPLVAARSEGAGPDILAELERAKQLALEVRNTLARQRRRETELAALFETAGDLAGMRDLDAVLHAITHRARALLGADVAYLTLEDPERGDTYMRVTDGSVSAAFQGLRLAMGSGLGGLVAQTGKPYVTADYQHDNRFRHTGEIDRAVAEEGLVAILGVPLRSNSHVIGVLFASNRTPRPFAHHEITLLSSLAAHAAIAIDSARLLQDTRTALEELSIASRLVRAHSDAVERAAAAHDRLADLVLRGGSVQDIAETVVEVLGGRLIVVDATGEPLALAGGLEDDTDSGESADAVHITAHITAHITPRVTGHGALIAEAAAAGRAVRDGHRMVVSLSTAGQEPLGALILTRPEACRVSGVDLFSDADQQILERTAVVVALQLLIGRSAAEAEERLRGDLLTDLLAVPVRHPATLRDRARRVGVDLDRPHVVLAIECAPADRPRVGFAAGRVVASRRGLAAAHEGRWVLMVPGDDPAAVAAGAFPDLSAAGSRPVTMGAGGPVSGVENLAAGHTEAVRCLTALLSLDRCGSAAAMSDLGFVGVVLGGADPKHFVRTALGPLLDYDDRRGTELVATLEHYFDTGASLIRTGEAMHIHVNTVTQRLDRIGRLLGADWQEPGRSLELRLALRLLRVGGLGGGR
jgi:GAF domain-containing protein